MRSTPDDGKVIDEARSRRRDKAARTGRATFWLAVVSVITVLIYLPGQSGPFLFDDISNLEPLGAWLSGVIGWQEVLLGNTSGLFGRTLSMASFMLDARLFGAGPLPFKVTNLLIHLACGALVFVLCRTLFARDAHLRAHAPWWALGVAAVWLLHPLQVSTVLYVVQRMAQLSTVGLLLALLCYLRGRSLLERGPLDPAPPRERTRAALAWLFLAFPLATLAATLAKENGALAPLLALGLELAYFRDATQPRAVRTFFAVFLLLPGLAIVGWYALHPQSILIGYETRDFTLGQRLLSEPRALLDYVAALLLPRGAALGLYGDDFTASTGWLTPLSTLPAIAFWIVAAVAAWWLRRCSSTLFAGAFLFLAGHAMESTVFSLELYFEHRNYLPSLGVFLAVAALLERGYACLRRHTDATRLVPVAAIALLLALGLATHMRAWSWQTWSVIVTQAVATHPESMRAQLDLAALYIKSGQPERAYEVFAKLRNSPLRTARNVGAIDPVVLDCQTRGAVQPEHLAGLRAVAGQRLGGYEITAVKMLVEQLDARACEGLSNGELAALLADLARRAPQNPSTFPVWTLRHIAADFYARAGDLAHARDEAQAAWSASANASVGMLLVRLLGSTQQYDEAERVLAEVRPRVRGYDTGGQRSLSALSALLIEARQQATESPGT